MSDFDLNRPPSLLLEVGAAFSNLAGGVDIIELEPDEIATPGLDIDRELE
jgi:hypothetical protein